MAVLECLSEIMGLNGGCEDISSNAEIYLDTKVTYSELNDFVDQTDVSKNTVAKLFGSLRDQAALELVGKINEQMAGGYIHKTVVKSQFIGDAGTTLTASAASAVLKGVRFQQYNSYPSYQYRVSRLGFIGNYTGNVTVIYYDGLTGQQLATDTVAAIAGQRIELNVNRTFRTEILTVVYDATGIDGYQTTVNGSAGTCYSCRGNANKINGYCYGQALTAPIGTPLDPTYTNDMGGLTVTLNVECDNQSWICNIKQQLGIAMLYKTAELAMEYGLNNTSRENTSTIRDASRLDDRHQMYHELYESNMKSALAAISLPTDSPCFVCKRKSRITQAIP